MVPPVLRFRSQAHAGFPAKDTYTPGPSPTVSSRPWWGFSPLPSRAGIHRFQGGLPFLLRPVSASPNLTKVEWVELRISAESARCNRTSPITGIRLQRMLGRRGGTPPTCPGWWPGHAAVAAAVYGIGAGQAPGKRRHRGPVHANRALSRNSVPVLYSDEGEKKSLSCQESPFVLDVSRHPKQEISGLSPPVTIQGESTTGDLE